MNSNDIRFIKSINDNKSTKIIIFPSIYKTKTKNRILLILFCFILFLSGCSQAEEDLEEYSGVISNDQALGYEYTVTKEEHIFTWKIRYKGNITTIEENINNKKVLEDYRMAVIDGHLILGKLIISLSYFLIVSIITLILFKKSRKNLHAISPIIIILACIALFISFESSIELNSKLKEIKHYYLTLTS